MKQIALLVALLPSVALAKNFSHPKLTHNDGAQVVVQDRMEDSPLSGGRVSTKLESLFYVDFEAGRLPSDNPLSSVLFAKMVIKMDAQVDGKSRVIETELPALNVGSSPGQQVFRPGFVSEAVGPTAISVDHAPGQFSVTGRKIFLYGNGQEYTNYGSGVPVALP